MRTRTQVRVQIKHPLCALLLLTSSRTIRIRWIILHYEGTQSSIDMKRVFPITTLCKKKKIYMKYKESCRQLNGERKMDATVYYVYYEESKIFLPKTMSSWAHYCWRCNMSYFDVSSCSCVYTGTRYLPTRIQLLLNDSSIAAVTKSHIEHKTV